MHLVLLNVLSLGGVSYIAQSMGQTLGPELYPKFSNLSGSHTQRDSIHLNVATEHRAPPTTPCGEKCSLRWLILVNPSLQSRDDESADFEEFSWPLCNADKEMAVHEPKDREGPEARKCERYDRWRPRN